MLSKYGNTVTYHNVQKLIKKMGKNKIYFLMYVKVLTSLWTVN